MKDTELAKIAARVAADALQIDQDIAAVQATGDSFVFT